MIAIQVDRRKFRVFTRKDIDRIPELGVLSADERMAMKAVAAVLPFRVNNYVLGELIDWSAVPDDPIYQLVFPQPGMLAQDHFDEMWGLVSRDAPPDEVRDAARRIQNTLNAHPGGQRELNVPRLDGQPLPGIQHKYRETVLFFPAAGQTCHSYCTYCFRWAQFVGAGELKFASKETDSLVRYLAAHPEVSNVLITGGDPLVMKTAVLRRYVEPLLDPSLDHIRSIRIGSKAPAYWPQRFVSDADADDLLRLFDEVRESGRHLALMAHYSHPRELETQVACEAVRRIRLSGAVVRSQAPIVRRVNDSAEVWAALWQEQVKHGVVPYYMFVARDTGAQEYFKIPLAQALEIFNGAYRSVSGLSRTVRGPSMSATPGKVLVNGVMKVQGEEVFLLTLLQGRDPNWVGRPFFARFDPEASWLDELVPAFGKSEFFFEQRLREMQAQLRAQAHEGAHPPPHPRHSHRHPSPSTL